MDRHKVKDLFLSEVKQLNGVILEIGFGEPSFFEKFSKENIVFGAEFSNSLVENTKTFLVEQNISNRVRVHRCASAKLPFHDNSFDYVVLSFCFCCFSKPQQMLKEMYRVTKDGGHILSFDHIRSNGIIGLLLDLLSSIHACMHRKNCHLNRNPLIYYYEQSIKMHSMMRSKETFIPWLYTRAIIKK